MGIENPVHLMFLAAVALVVLGPKRLPELTRAAGKSIREFREALNGGVVDEPPSAGQVSEPPSAGQVSEPPSAGQLDEPPPVTRLAEPPQVG
jgi:sec-independent protein translocase protein TatA